MAQVAVGDVFFGASEFPVIAGPCSIESEEHFRKTARYVVSQGAQALRGGVYKLRTNPESFQGLGTQAISWAEKIKTEVKCPFFVEITDPRQIESLDNAADVFQVGSRNMHNYELLKEIGRTQKPVLLKRGFCSLIDEWLKAADYVIQSGNEKVILCERGIRTFETKMRNTFDLNAVAYIKQYTSFPVIADPSHATGDSSLVIPMALSAAAAGADGLIVEVHPEPQKALSDGPQALTFEQFQTLMKKLRKFLSTQEQEFKEEARL